MIFRLALDPQFYPVKRKLIYCSRTVPEIEKALSELKRLMEYRISNAETDEQRARESAFTGVGLTSRKNLCIHPEVKCTVPVICVIYNLHLKVSKEKKGKVVDARCRDLTNTATVNKARAEPRSVEVCDFHEVRDPSFPLAPRYHSKTCWKNMNEIQHDRLLSPGGIWTLADILQHGRETSTCPYFTIRRSVCSRLLFFAMEN